MPVATRRTLTHPALLGLAIAISLAGCAGLPDQRLANQALQNGDTELAQQNFQQLADLGYADAQIGLADIQVNTGDPEAMRKAEAIYRAAAQTSPRAQVRLGRLLAAKPGSTVAEQHEAESWLKKAAQNGETGTLLPLATLYLQYPQSFPNIDAQKQIDQWLAAGYPDAPLAQVMLYRAKGTYDQHLDDIERICKAALSANDVCYVELATVYQKRGQADRQAELVKQLQSAYNGGTASAARIDGVARVLSDPTLGKTDEKTAQTLLESVTDTYPAAYISLAQLLYQFPELGDVDKLMDYIDKGHSADPGRAELLLGKVYYEGKVVIPDAHKALDHLQKAAGTQVSAHYYMGQIYRRGYLGKPEPQKAVDELLKAARSGQNSADFALAQLYSGGRGTKPNLVNAYVFVQLAKMRPDVQQPVTDLNTLIESELQPGQKAQAQQLMQQELKARGGISQANSALAQQEMPADPIGEDKSL
ncbi:alginate biosynthesis protein AlgK [Pseudomonas sp. MWU16-30317]|uniref:alginate biosynthesis protein AlgK n=1 Tax=Pseudomonas sp. MWU16-30317 TaxID=2878095 RepID=UPI001CFACDAE|nr:alginate biosynthesis protein AlgK [Pseudomonas sp. MWU16-30317]